jgi:hypothetical protein
MLLGHIAVALAGRRLTPGTSLGAWILAAMFVDLVWPILLLIGLEHVRIVPGGQKLRTKKSEVRSQNINEEAGIPKGEMCSEFLVLTSCSDF